MPATPLQSEMANLRFHRPTRWNRRNSSL